MLSPYKHAIGQLLQHGGVGLSSTSNLDLCSFRMKYSVKFLAIYLIGLAPEIHKEKIAPFLTSTTRAVASSKSSDLIQEEESGVFDV